MNADDTARQFSRRLTRTFRPDYREKRKLNGQKQAKKKTQHDPAGRLACPAP